MKHVQRLSISKDPNGKQKPTRFLSKDDEIATRSTSRGQRPQGRSESAFWGLGFRV